MIKSTGHADLPLHVGTVPKWLADRMMVLGTLIVESLIQNFGRKEVLVRLSDPMWFQSLGAVLGMDWHSSGITTSVMYALKRGLNPRSKELGIYICGGRGKYSKQTPDELIAISNEIDLNENDLIRSSKLCAKVDNTAIQDGFQLYQHNFILSKEGDWAVVQQGMNANQKKARRYHWCSSNLESFVQEPHTGVVGENYGKILNLTAKEALKTRNSILEISKENPDSLIKEIQKISKIDNSSTTFGYGGSSDKIEQGYLFPEYEDSKENKKVSISIPVNEIIYSGRNITLLAHHDVKKENVDLKRLGAVLVTAYESEPKNFENLLLTPGLGPRTLQSLALVSEVIYGTQSRFLDPARFSFAHGGKDGHPFPVPLKVYDETIRVMHESIEKSKLGYKDKSECLYRLQKTVLDVERKYNPEADFDAVLKYERANSKQWGGKTVSSK